MDRTIDRADIEEYEEIVGNFGQYSDRVEPENAQAVPIQEPTSIQREILMTRTDPGIYK